MSHAIGRTYRILLALAVLILALPTFAFDAKVVWPLPTKYPDGTAMPASDFAFVTISWVQVGTGAKGTLNTAAMPPTITIKTPCGKYIFTGSYTTSTTAHVPGATSNNATATFDSGVVCPTPLPPQSVTVH